MDALKPGGVVRRRGAFGEDHAPLSDLGFAHSRTIDALWRKGLLRPAEGYATYEAAPPP